jgi:hypothetical protein
MLNLDDDLRQGLFYGVNSGVLTTMGVLGGLSQVTSSFRVIIIAILSLGLSDGLSEGHSLWFSKKAKNTLDDSNKPLKAGIGLITAKMLVTLSFLIPLLFVKDLTIYKNMSFPIIWSVILLLTIDTQLIKLRTKENVIDYLIPQVVIIILLIGMTLLFNNV